MKRREFLGLLGVATAGWPFLVRAQQAQQAGRVYRLGYLTGGTAASRRLFLAAFHRGMRELGYIEGQNLTFEYRYADGRFDRLPALARELLGWNPDVLLVSTTPGNLAAKAATSTVPIVMVAVADPLGAQLVESLPRPGGNITGVTNIAAELAGKRLEIVKEIVPAASKVAILINPDDQNASLQMRIAAAAANKLAIQLEPILHIRSAADLKGAFEEAVRAGAGAAMRMADPLATALRAQAVAYAAEFRMPTIYAFQEDVLAGGLVSYGPSMSEQYRQAATFVHKILKGAKPADLPVEQPTKFELALNLKTARALGIDIPSRMVAVADEVVE